MARPTRGAGSFVVGAPGTAPAAANLDAPSQATDDILADLEEERSRPPEARIHRLNPLTRKFGFLDQIDASIADESWVRETYGGGEYRLLTYGTRADGTWGYLKGKLERVSVDDSIPFKGSLRERIVRGAVPTGEKPPKRDDDADPDMAQLFKSQLIGLVREQSENRNTATTMLMSMMQQQGQAMQQFMQMMITLMTTGRQQGGGLGELKDILGPLITGISSKKDPAEIAATLMAAMKDQPGASSKDPMRLFKDFLEIKALMGEGGGKDSDAETDPWLRIIEKTLPGVMDVLKSESEKTGRPVQEIASGRRSFPPVAATSAPPSLPPASSSVPVSGSVAGSPVVPEHAADQWTPIEPYAAQLAGFARQNKEPYSVMHLILTVAPAELLATLREVVARDDCLPFLIERFPVLAAHQAWTAQLVEAFRAELFAEEEEEDEPAPGEPGPPEAPSA